MSNRERIVAYRDTFFIERVSPRRRDYAKLLTVAFFMLFALFLSYLVVELPWILVTSLFVALGVMGFVIILLGAKAIAQYVYTKEVPYDEVHPPIPEKEKCAKCHGKMVPVFDIETDQHAGFHCQYCHHQIELEETSP